MKSIVIGIDVGTSGCKVLALDKSGELVASGTESYPLYQPEDGWSEQDPEDWWQGVLKALRAVLKKTGEAQIAGIGFSGQMHGMVALDSEGRVVRPAILWNDQRTQKQCDEITEAAGGAEGLLSFTNNMMLTGYTGGKILWMREDEPENYGRTALVLNPKDYIRFRLTGLKMTDASDASGTGLFDVKNRGWALELIDRIGLRRELFPQVTESTAQAGVVTREAAKLSGLPEGTPVFAGGGDAVISTVGLGLAAPGKVGVTLGTSGVVAMGLPGFAPNPKGKLQLFCGNAPGLWTAFGCTLAAAGSYSWLRDSLGAGEGFRELDSRAAEVPAGSGGLIFLPYITGERCPIFDPEARGGFFGLRAQMGRGHFARAVLEGVCFSLKQVYDMIKESSGICGDEIYIAGGGAQSQLWRGIFADVFGLPVRTVCGSAEGGAFGAALVAGIGGGFWDDMAQATAVVRQESETLPNRENAGVYAEMYNKYCRIYPALKNLI